MKATFVGGQGPEGKCHGWIDGWMIKLRTKWTGRVALMGERRISYKILMGKPEGRRQLERLRHRWKDNIKMDLQEVEWSMYWIDRSIGHKLGGWLLAKWQ
jgi:hypothetical protein